MATMPESVKKILEEVEYFKDAYFVYDLPIPFNGVNIYPVTVRNYTEFLSCSSVCSLNKNDDPNGIKMTHLEYILNKMNNKDSELDSVMWSMKFSRLIELCLHVKNGLKCPQCGEFMSYDEYIAKINDENNIDKRNILSCNCGGKFEETIKYRSDEQTKKPILIIDGQEFTSEKYNKMRQYILYQNLPDYKDDSWVDHSVREDEALKAELTSRGSGTASLERKILGLSMNSNYKVEEIYNLTIRKFIQMLGMIDDMINYTTTKQGLMSGMVSLKAGTSIEHWLYKKDEGMYGKAVDADAYVSQIKSAQ